MQPRLSQIAVTASSLVLLAGLMACGSEGDDLDSTSIRNVSINGEAGGSLDDEGGGEDDGETCSPIDGLKVYGYWRSHEKDWPIDPDTELCGQTWFEIMHTPPKGGNAWYILAHHWIAAELNYANVDKAPSGFENTLSVAFDMLNDDCKISNRKSALSLAEDLEAYNEGELFYCE